MEDKRAVDRLVFIFDAESGAWNAFVDSAKKMLRLNGCALCRITHGAVAQKGEWNDCEAALGVPIEYLHRDELTAELQAIVGDALPCILAEVGGDRGVLLDRSAIARCRGSVEDLRGKLLFHAARMGFQL